MHSLDLPVLVHLKIDAQGYHSDLGALFHGCRDMFAVAEVVDLGMDKRNIPHFKEILPTMHGVRRLDLRRSDSSTARAVANFLDVTPIRTLEDLRLPSYTGEPVLRQIFHSNALGRLGNNFVLTAGVRSLRPEYFWRWHISGHDLIKLSAEVEEEQCWIETPYNRYRFM